MILFILALLTGFKHETVQTPKFKTCDCVFAINDAAATSRSARASHSSKRNAIQICKYGRSHPGEAAGIATS